MATGIPTETLTLLERAALLSGVTTFETRAFPHAGIRAIHLSDGPHGVRKQMGATDHLGLAGSAPATCFPTAATIANSWDPALAERVGVALGTEADSLGVDVLLGPGLNIKRSPLGGRNFEYFSEDPLLAGRLAAAYIRGIQSCGVSACPKHFAANSQETRRMTSDSVVDERTLRELYLTGFEIAVREGKPWTLMSSYNRVNGTYAHENPFLLTEVLRDEWGFDGAVVSDWGGANDVVASIRAGGTLEMPSPGLDSARQIVAAVKAGELDGADLDARVTEMIRLTRRVGPARSREPFDQQAHHRLAREAAAAGAVLLKNEGILPLAPRTRVALVGDFVRAPRYQGAGSSLVNPTRLSTPLAAMRASGVEIVSVARGFTRGGERDAALEREAIRAAREAEVVVVHLGLDEVSETEGRDREHLRLPACQTALLRVLASTGTPVVVVLSAGSVLEMPWLDHCAALVHGYLGGQAGAEGMADILTGQVAPSGRLAETYPMHLEDTPTHRHFPGPGAQVEYREGTYVGYRYYTAADVAVRFPFGFGLTYTTFEYRDLEVDDAGVSFVVTNTGQVAGVEVSQLYVGPVPDDGPYRPTTALAGFTRVALDAAESRRVRIPFDEYTFRSFDTATRSWCVPGGEWRVLVAADAADARLEGRHATQGPELTKSAVGLPERPAATVADVDGVPFARRLGGGTPPKESQDGFGMNDPLGAMQTARSPLARIAHRVLSRLIARAESRGTPDLNLLFLDGMPPRAIAKMTNGTVSMDMAESLVTMIDGHLLRGAGGLAAASLRKIQADRRTRHELERAVARSGR